MSPPSEVKKKKQLIHARAQEEPDFIRVKAKDQVPITTFWTAIDPYFRPLAEEDRTFLMERADTSKAFLIPPLGEHYQDQWSREDQLLQTKSPFSARINAVDPQHIKLRYIKDPITEDQLLQDDLSSGSLTERLLSSLVTEDKKTDCPVIKQEEDEEEEDDDDEEEDEEETEESTLEIFHFEERLKRELRYAGLFTEDDVRVIVLLYPYIYIYKWLFRLIGMQERMMRFVQSCVLLDVDIRNKWKLMISEKKSCWKLWIVSYSLNNIGKY